MKSFNTQFKLFTDFERGYPTDDENSIIAKIVQLKKIKMATNKYF